MGEFPELSAAKKFVQLLTIIRPCASHPVGKILLCKWLSGDFENRYTGLWGEFQPEHDGNDLRHALVRLETCSESEYLTGTKWNIQQLDLMAVFEFDVPTPNLEYIFMFELPADADPAGSTVSSASQVGNDIDGAGKKRGGIRNGYVGSPDVWKCEWFDLDKIPFDQMPADDALWYDLVVQGQKLTGKFVFAGEPKYALKYHEINKIGTLDLPEVSAQLSKNAEQVS